MAALSATCVQEFTKNIKREFGRLVSVLQAYALIATHARILVTNQAGKTPARSMVLSTNAPAAAYAHLLSAAAPASTAAGAVSTTAGSGSSSLAAVSSTSTDPCVQAELAAMRDNITAVFGAKVVETLEPLAVVDGQLGLTMAGFVSKAGCGLKGDTSRQFFFLNGRPVDLPKVSWGEGHGRPFVWQGPSVGRAGASLHLALCCGGSSAWPPGLKPSALPSSTRLPAQAGLAHCCVLLPLCPNRDG